MKRTRLRPRSQKTILAAPLKAMVRAEVFTRDGHRCLLRYRVVGHFCLGDLTVHHLKKASQGGRYEKLNLVTLCAGANIWVEDWPITAHDLGLVCWRGDTLRACWDRLLQAGLVARVPEGL